MSFKSIASLVALGAMATTAAALPSLSVIDLGSGSGKLQVNVTGTGSIGAELTLELTGATLTGATINSAIFDTANPGDNPYIAGSPVGGDSTGLALGLANNRLFASYGSGSVAPGTYDFLTFTYTGNGTATGAGKAAQLGVLTSGLTSGAVNIGTPVGFLAGDFDGNSSVGNGDLTLLLSNWAAAVPPVAGGWIGAQPTAPNVGNDELTALLSTWGQSNSSAVAIPEPTACLLLLVGAAVPFSRRR